jgi:hypothetical protein
MLLLPSASRLLPQIRPCPSCSPVSSAAPADPHSPSAARFLSGTDLKGHRDELPAH